MKFDKMTVIIRRDIEVTETWKNTSQKRHLLRDIHQNVLIYPNF